MPRCSGHSLDGCADWRVRHPGGSGAARSGEWDHSSTIVMGCWAEVMRESRDECRLASLHSPLASRDKSSEAGGAPQEGVCLVRDQPSPGV